MFSVKALKPEKNVISHFVHNHAQVALIVDVKMTFWDLFCPGNRNDLIIILSIVTQVLDVKMTSRDLFT